MKDSFSAKKKKIKKKKGGGQGCRSKRTERIRAKLSIGLVAELLIDPLVSIFHLSSSFFAMIDKRLLSREPKCKLAV
jgi:hypothetical protein